MKRFSLIPALLLALTLNGPALAQYIPPPLAGGKGAVFIVQNNTTPVAISTVPAYLTALYSSGISASTPVYIKFYDAAAGSVTCGSGTPVLDVMIPASGGVAGSGVVLPTAVGLTFNNAITACVTASMSFTDTTAPAANTYIVNAVYRPY